VLSVEETNKLRAALGLKPLKIENPNAAKEKELKLQKEEEKKRKTMEIAAKIVKVREERQYKEQISSKSIAEEGDDDVLAWVQKSRIMQVEKIKKEKELAEQRARMLDELDQEVAQSTLPSKYTQKDLKGLKIAHETTDIVSTDEPIVLTLKDVPILKDSDLNEEDDMLESLKLAEKEKLKENAELKKKKPRYDDMYSQEKKDVLSKYDDPKSKEGTKINADGSIKLESDLPMEEVEGKALFSLDFKKTEANEYFTEKEMVKFKKVATKKKKIRKKPLEFEPMEGESTQSTDHGSRSESLTLKKRQDAKEEEKEKKQKGYAKAIEKAAEESKVLLEKSKNVSNESDDMIVDEDTELIKSISRARSKAVGKKETSDVAAVVLERARMKEQILVAAPPSDPALVFTATTEFIRSIQPETETAPVKAKRKEKERKRKEGCRCYGRRRYC